MTFETDFLDDEELFNNLKTNDLYANMTNFHGLDKVNINPLIELPETKLRLYGFNGLYKNIYFDTKDELKSFIRCYNQTYGTLCVLDYLGDVASKKDVIKKTYNDGYFTLYTIKDDNSYLVYNYEKSVYLGHFIWEDCLYNLDCEYEALIKRGLSDNKDIMLLTKSLKNK